MTIRISDVRRRARAIGTDLLLAAPALVRGDTLRGAVAREFARRLDRSKDDRGRRWWSRALRSRHGDASRAASGAAVIAMHPGRLVEELRRRAVERPDDVGLQLDLCAVLRRTGRNDEARDVLARVHRVGRADVAALLREVHAIAGRDAAADMLRGVTGADPGATAALAAAALVAAEAPRRPLVDVARDHLDDAEVLRAVVRHADGLTEREELARLVLGSPGASDVSAVAALATDLRESGDLRLSTALARRSLQQSRDAAMSRLVTLGESGIDTLERGWQPPPRSTSRAEQSSRVLYLLHSSLPYTNLGYATRTQGLLHAVRSSGWDVRGVTQPGYPEGVEHPPRDVVDGVPNLRLPLDGALPHWPVSRMVATYREALAPLVAAEQPGILHAASNYRNGLAAVDLGRRSGIPTVYEVRGLWQLTRLVREPEFQSTDMFALLERLEAQAAALADRTIVITRALGDHLVSLGVPEDRLVVVPNGVDTERFQPRQRDVELASSLGVGDRTVIGYVGGLVEYEGLDLLLEAADEMRRRRDDFVVLVVGDGRSLPGLKAIVADRGLGDLVVFTGRVPHEDVERYYSLVDIAPFPRRPELVCELVSPLKPFEAMAMGKAVVASDVAALAEIIDDGDTGRLFAKGSSSALAAVLDSLLDSSEHRAAIAARGSSWVRQERDWTALASRVGDVYAELQERVHSR